jgi:thiol-disulfide isomerase/thioredoxin
VVVAVAACTVGGGRTGVPAASDLGGAPPASPTTSAAGASDGAVRDPTTPAAPTPGVAMTQPWATAELVDVRTGEMFRIADLVADGNVVVVETMAIWCPNCARQGAEVNAALAELGPTANVVYVVLDIDLPEDAADLAAYQAQYGFDGRYVVAGIPVARALAEDFGANMLNPPLTPMVIVGTDGVGTLTEHGPKSSEQIVALVRAAGA